MDSIVLDLQRDAAASDSKVSFLLRKAYMIARKLKVNDFETWIHNELNGYIQVSEVPPYRVMQGEIMCWNPFHGWRFTVIPDIKLQEKITKHTNCQGIPELEHLLEIEGSEQGIYAPLPDSYSQIFNYNTKYRLELSLVQISKIDLFNNIKSDIMKT